LAPQNPVRQPTISYVNPSKLRESAADYLGELLSPLDNQRDGMSGKPRWPVGTSTTN